VREKGCKLNSTRLRADNKPDLVVELAACVRREPSAYADVLGRETISDPAKLVAQMLDRFVATDRGFTKVRRQNQPVRGYGCVRSTALESLLAGLPLSLQTWLRLCRQGTYSRGVIAYGFGKQRGD
jgi:hypothetical protein